MGCIGRCGDYPLAPSGGRLKPMSRRSTLRLGTRGSLLAVAQSRLVLRALRGIDPGQPLELVSVETRGDRDRDTPLSAVGDPGFFSAELDRALLTGQVDFCVHSVKDLPLEPRPGIRQAAVPAREQPHDVVLFRADAAELIASDQPLRIGTSSTRRATLAGGFLREALPRLGAQPPQLAFAPLRGPVEQRLARLRLPRAHPQALDGAVLALAGLARLWGDRDGHAALAPLLQDTRLMLLPLSACPTAAGQGALAVDCRDGDARVAGLLAQLHDAATARRVARELSLAAALPAGERDGFAASSLPDANCGTLLFMAGSGAARPYHRLAWRRPPPPAGARAWDGSDWAGASHLRRIARPSAGNPGALFLAHWRAWPDAAPMPPDTRVWVSGVESWRQLARRGVWVEGCADNLGFRAITPLLATAVLRLPPLADWTVMTREDAVASWHDSGVGRVQGTYAIDSPSDPVALAAIRAGLAQSTHFYWGSAAQFQALRDWLPTDAHHACGPGKTFQALRAQGVGNLHPFPSRQEWRSWLA